MAELTQRGQQLVSWSQFLRRFHISMKVSIIIAVYNEAATVGTLLNRVWVQPLAGASKEIIIVESNSTDGSRELVADFVRRHGQESPVRVQAIYQPRPMGKGHAIRQGFAAATGDIFLIQDADLEYDVADYPSLLTPIIEGRTAFVLGSRHMGADHWNIRKFAHGSVQALYMNAGGMIFHWFFNAVFSTHLTDPTSMYKVFRSDCLTNLTFTSTRFDFDFELLAKLIRAGFSPLEIPVAYKSRGFNEGKKIRVLRDPFTWILAILKCRYSALRVAGKQSQQRLPSQGAAESSPRNGLESAKGARRAIHSP
ncbi:MAG: glycosyltransferase family 2 protein [Steroidobacteraceae bacterium]